MRRRVIPVAGMMVLIATVSIPQAAAQTIMGVVFNANITLDGGISYPIIGGIPTLLPGINCLLLNDITDTLVPETNCALHWSGNQRSITIATRLACGNAGLHGGKLEKDLWKGGQCSFSAAPGGYLRGFCGLNGGVINLIFTDNTGQTYSVVLHFNTFARVQALSGHFSKWNSGQRGLVLGYADEFNFPEFVGMTDANSCLNGTADTFDVNGWLLFLPTG